MPMSQKKSIEDVCVRDRRVIVRVDFNVPQDKKTGAITDDKRIQAALPTIRYLIDHGARTILVSHLGRPKGGPEPQFSMKPCADRLAELLGRPVVLASDVIGPDAKAKAAALQPGEVLMLENVRFEKNETKNDVAFARELASMADIFVNDAFGTAHRAHASTAGLARFLPAVSGFLIQKELEIIGSALANPRRPFVAILGGAKVSDKIGVISSLIEKVDTLLIGGGMAYTFMAAQGLGIGSSICEQDKIDLARQLMEKAAERKISFLLPSDLNVTDRFAADADHRVVDADAIPDGWMGLDIGPNTIAAFSEKIKGAGTIVWNGPMGVFEYEAFAIGTREVARAVAESGAISIIGGGDSAAAVEALGFADKVTHISTGGGASLEFLEGKVLPGVACLLDKNPRRTLAAGNWKMNLGVPEQAQKLLGTLLPMIQSAESQVVAAVPFTALAAALETCAYSKIQIAAQNCHAEAKGAYTGEISSDMLAAMGVSFVIIGHSERRALFGETDEAVNRKIKAALNVGVRPIICCGETLDQREAGQTESVVSAQIRAAYAGLSAAQTAFTTVAYEPVWAIGTGKVATDEQAQEVCAQIRGLIAGLYDTEVAQNLRILYGGSVNAQNASGLFAQPDIDGGLVGGASLKADEFAAICQA